MVVCHNYEYVDGDPDIATLSEHLQNRRKIDKISRSSEWLRLVSLGSDEEETFSSQWSCIHLHVTKD